MNAPFTGHNHYDSLRKRPPELSEQSLKFNKDHPHITKGVPRISYEPDRPFTVTLSSLLVILLLLLPSVLL